MPELTIGRMAKLYGLHRSSLYEAVAKGRVSAGHDAKGQRVIDLSEMIRVYGEPPSGARHPTPASPTARDAPDSSALLDEIRKQTAVIERMAERIERLEHAMLRLPAPEPQKEVNSSRTHNSEQDAHVPPEKPQEPRTPQAKATGPISFADIEARLRERLRDQS